MLWRTVRPQVEADGGRSFTARQLLFADLTSPATSASVLLRLRDELLRRRAGAAVGASTFVSHDVPPHSTFTGPRRGEAGPVPEDRLPHESRVWAYAGPPSYLNESWSLTR